LTPRLPRHFLLGTATSAYQYEGGNVNSDWAAFEAARGLEPCEDALDGWPRMLDDVALMRDLGANAHRFSIEWSRVEPVSGHVDEAAWRRYTDLVHHLEAHAVTPMVTLLHFSLPQWLEGGLLAPDFPARFAAFAAEAERRFPTVSLWCTVNEPNVHIGAGYVDAIWPPGRRSLPDAVRAFLALRRAHLAAAHILRTPARSVGVALNAVRFYPAHPTSPIDRLAAAAADRIYNWSFPDAVRGSLDWLGLNYYTCCFLRGLRRHPGPGPLTDMGWAVHPRGLPALLTTAARRYALPLYVTENGIADAEGHRRGAFLQAHLEAVQAAVRDGVDVRGYFHWSLVDNFEWAEGLRPRFGLYRADRTPAPGADVFRQWAGREGRAGMAAKHPRRGTA
jgi:beta-glucosidase